MMDLLQLIEKTGEQFFPRFILTVCKLQPEILIAAKRQRGSTLFLTLFGSSRVHSTESFARSMYCRDLDLVSVCMFVVIPGA